MYVCLGPYDGTMDLGRARLLKMVKEAGYDGVSIQMGVLFGKRFIQDFDRDDWEDLRGHLRRLNLIAPTIMTPAFWPLTHPGYKTLACDLLRLYINCATFFGATQVGIWPTPPMGIDRAPAIATMKENLLTVLPEARKANVSVALEFEDRGVIVEYKDMLDLVDQTDPALGIVLDTMHLHHEKADPAQAVLEMGRRIGMVHFSDTGRALPGQGCFDFGSFVGALKQIQYSGSVDVVFKCKDPAEIASAREYVRSVGI